MKENTEISVTMRYEQDSKRYHRYRIVDPEGYVTGSLYFSKDIKELPDRVVIARESQ